MKRGCAGDDVDDFHPSVCFHREVLTCVQWSAIRRDFVEALQTTPLLHFTEPKKLWRHSHEALGKWILSQVARDTHSKPAGTGDSGSGAGHLLYTFTSSFYPSDNTLSRGTYDEQLIRDISIKCTAPNNPEIIRSIKQLVEKFNLAERCRRAAAEVRRQLEVTNPSSFCVPVVRTIAAHDEVNRTPTQRRIKGPIATVDVVWPRNIPRDMRSGCPQVSVPLAAYRKLEMSYRHFADKLDGERYPRLTYDKRLTMRAATLVLRYECGLATGSLQLCADPRLKQHLHAAGYRVMDLCASPINAYMGAPREGLHHRTEGCETDETFIETENVPNYFCSAFPDTDCYFGSLGSVLNFDVAHAYNAPEINPDRRPLLLTLDVPYDEDLCEGIFLKLVTDMKRAENNMEGALSDSTNQHFIADYVLVLPLWWDVPLKIKKLLFSGADSNAESTSVEDEEAKLDEIIMKRSAMLKEGYVLTYEWPERLAEAAGEQWPCFDGVFVSGSYEYFCTITNRALSDVTATEVIGLAQPRGRKGDEASSGNSEFAAGPMLPSLSASLRSFYGRPGKKES
uniref:Uncharacterized protein TCIL3000_8_6060 n=1 Tax=Trypanosoma congolense (strain IL3000) TaxID=1068625 RepID=G0USL6_TRYCI|nr:unnamed protein product [Trypanosoma congolense IL3000]